ncbi:hypothetical protein EW145_g1178 [Phellinidium pouzarii]|uniref:DUF300-domain-containing protein n=1 Tax=Phellinidium pouzarii TaxID=167371 RepID=A0A4S4LFH3_9AGAM|nr:hypothetical protein EW145_g1178 [Phellinidium pouzarii]
MYCLFQLYLPISECLAPHRPLLKLFSIKAVVFLTFWQATFLSILSFAGVVKDTQYMTADDINIGIGAILETVEMTIFALLHIKAFSYKPYCTPFADPDVLSQRRPRLRALLHAFDFRETLRELWTGWLYIIRRWRGAETDGRARRLLVRKDLFDVSLVLGSRSQRGSSGMGKQLLSYAPVREGPDQFARVDEKYDGCDLAIAIEVEKEFHIKDERQRIGTGDDYIYGLGLSRHERSAGPAEQIEDELDRRCLPARVSYGISQARENIKEQPTDIDALMNDGVEEPECHGRKRRSWWGGMYDRLSHSGGYNAQDVFDPALKSRMQKSNKDRQCNAFTAGDSIEREYYYSAVEENLYDEPPPPSSIWEHWKSESTLSNAVTCFRPDSVVFTPCTPDESSPTTVQDFGPHPSTKLSPEDDATFARLFPDPPTSVSLNARNSTTEASGPSSQTHPSSDGNHVRLITPALVMPTLEWRATVRMPVVVGHSAAESRSTSTKASFDEERGLPHEIQNERSQPYGRLGVFDEAPSAIHLNRNSGESLARRHRRKYARHESLTANPPYMERKYVIRPLPFAPAPRRNFRSPTVHHAYVPKPDVAAERPQDSFTSYPSIQSIHTIQEDDAHKHGPRLKRREAKHTLRQAHSDAYIPTFISARQLTRVATASMPLRNHGAQPSMIYPHSADRSRARVHVRPRPRLNFPRHGVQEQAV